MTDETKSVDPNEKFKIMGFRQGGTTIRVYLLNPGEVFQGFGGSRHGLQVNKTASLIVSEVDHERRDVEYDLRGKDGTWEKILTRYRMACGLLE
jgi:hypothetical protein